MAKKIIVSFLMVISSLFINAQTSCGTPQTSTPKDFRPEVGEFSNNILCVNIQFHVVRDNNGNSSVTNSTIDQLVNILNNHFNPHNIYIKKLGVDFINNSTYYNMSDSSFNSLTQINNKSNAINFYIINSCTDWAGRAGDITSRNLVMTAAYLLSGVSSHEVGHCLNLWHTFQGTRPGTSGCAEAINGSNCLTCGDYVCDTPADQNYGAVNGYNPDMTNNMSYYSPFTLNHFTNLQGERMRNALKYSPVLQPVVNVSCSNIIGSDIICENSFSTYTLDNNFGLNVTWTVSSNLTIQASSQTNINVISNYGGNGYITANFQNGLSITKNIWIGTPQFKNITCSNSAYEVCNGAVYESMYNLPAIIAGNYVTANFDGINVATSTQTDWEWQPINNLINISKNKNKGLIALINFGSTGFKVRAKNSCGWSEWGEWYFEIIQTENQYMFRVSPNPASDYLIIDLKNKDKKPKNEKLTKFELIDMNGNSKIKTSSKELKVNTLNKGVYQLRIFYDNKIEIHQIIIK